MRIALAFAEQLHGSSVLSRVAEIESRLLGSLAFTGKGHATPEAVILGLSGCAPDTIDMSEADQILAGVREDRRLSVLGKHAIAFDPDTHIVFDYDTPADLHPNAMVCTALSGDGSQILRCRSYSTGGGCVASHQQLSQPARDDNVLGAVTVACPFGSAAELLSLCQERALGISEIMLANEDAFRSREQTYAGLDGIVEVMMSCIDRGLVSEGILPGGLNVIRRAPGLWKTLAGAPLSNEREQLFDWLNVYAMAVNEENASGGKVVTAPTNGAAGIIPAIIRHYCSDRASATGDRRVFLLTAGAIGLLYRQRASISGAEMGCQGEVGVACSMAAGGLAAMWGADPSQIACAAEIGMEHNLGLTCDPVGGLVQIPCIERNAIAAVKAVNAARLALHASDHTKVSLDQVIETMRQTGVDMSSKYKETSQGGLAVNVVEC